MIKETELQFQATELLELWKAEFLAATGSTPFMDVSGDTQHLKNLIRKSGFEYAKAIVRGYFKTKNEWVRDKGFPVAYLMNNLNEVVAGMGGGRADTGPIFVISISASGYPVLSRTQNCMGKDYWFTPILFEDWKNGTVLQKLQHPIEKFVKDPVGEWIATWRECGFLNEST